LSFHISHPFGEIKDEKFNVLLGKSALTTCHYCYFVLSWNNSEKFFSQIFFISYKIINSKRLPTVVSATSPTAASCVLPGRMAEGFSDPRH
jgi:hypothetical protein